MDEKDLKTPDETEKIAELKASRRARILRIWYVRFMAALLVCLFLFALLLPLRPRFSESENRELSPFPRFSFSALFSGRYFDEIAVWYADTFPMRDKFISLNTYLSGAYGQNEIRIHGKVEEADDIPTDASEISVDTSSTPVPEPTAQTVGALLYYGDTAYEYYNFRREFTDRYISTVNRAAALLEGKADVYAMVVPTSMGITAPEKITASIRTSDQEKALEYMYGSMSDKVKKVPLYNALKAHKDEYIYFRTDHHWTALGAYYAYAEWMRVKGVKPIPLTAYKETAFPGYLGSFYNANKDAGLKANPDTVYAYQPPSTNDASIRFNSNGQWKPYKIISDMTSASESSKYLTFIAGDNPITYIKNPNKNDGSVCLLIKESFGNAFAPFPVENYQYVYVLDYRYFAKYDKRGLVEYCDAIAGSSLDVIFLNNISATRNESLINSLSYFVK